MKRSKCRVEAKVSSGWWIIKTHVVATPANQENKTNSFHFFFWLHTGRSESVLILAWERSKQRVQHARGAVHQKLWNYIVLESVSGVNVPEIQYEGRKSNARPPQQQWWTVNCPFRRHLKEAVRTSHSETAAGLINCSRGAAPVVFSKRS